MAALNEKQILGSEVIFMREVVFVDGYRSVFGKMGGALKDFAGSEIAAKVIKGLLEHTKIMERGGVDSVFAGCALKDSIAADPARYAALAAGLPVEVPATFIEMQCGSAITAVNAAACQIAMGLSDVMIVGGMESWSRRVALFPMCTEPYKLIPPAAIEERLAPSDEENISMLEVSDAMAKRWGITREECDEYAYNSQMRLAEAYKKGITGNEIIPIVIPATRKTPEIVVDKDEFPRPQTTVEGLRKLPPVLEGGVTTAGNASGLNDGAAFLLMMTREKAEELGYTPMARWVTGCDVGVQPSIMGIGPAYSTLKALKQAGLTMADIDVFECNEAFAAQNLSVIKEIESLTGMKIDMKKWNPNGGAIAIGHPNGASGARIGMFAMRHLEQTGGRYGVFTACCGGGHGTTTVIENLRF
jgi:acetyl-CoA acetyltransferase family protein